MQGDERRDEARSQRIEERLLFAFGAAPEPDDALILAEVRGRRADELLEARRARVGSRWRPALPGAVAAGVLVMALLGVLVGQALREPSDQAIAKQIVARILLAAEEGPEPGTMTFEQIEIESRVPGGTSLKTVDVWRAWDGSRQRRDETETIVLDDGITTLPQNTMTETFDGSQQVRVEHRGTTTSVRVSIRPRHSIESSVGGQASRMTVVTPPFQHDYDMLQCQECHSTHVVSDEGGYPVAKDQTTPSAMARARREALDKELRSGNLHFAGERPTSLGSVYVLTQTRGNTRTELWVEAGAYRVVRRIEQHRELGRSGEWAWNTVYRLEYVTHRDLGASARPDAFFKTELPKRPYELSGKIAVSGHEEFDSFPVYWLGPAGIDESTGADPTRDGVAIDIGERVTDSSELLPGPYPASTEARIIYGQHHPLIQGLGEDLEVATYASGTLEDRVPPSGRVTIDRVGGRPVWLVATPRTDSNFDQIVLIDMGDAVVRLQGSDGSRAISTELLARIVAGLEHIN